MSIFDRSQRGNIPSPMYPVTTGGGGGGGGTVTSVAVTVPASILAVAGSPITASGTFAITLVNQSANTVFAGPTSGGSATPTVRSLVAADIPSLLAAKISDFSTAVLSIAANNSLSNLTATAINQDLTGDTGTLWQIGTKSSALGSTQDLYVRSGAASVSGNSGLLTIGSQFSQAGNSGPVSVMSGQINGLTGFSGTVTVGSGGVADVGSSGTSGDVILLIGALAGVFSTRGKIKFQDGSEGTSGYIWTSTDTLGSGHWAANSASANQSLSNLTTVSFNADLLPSGDGARNVGSSSLRIGTVFSNTVSAGAGTLTLAANGTIDCSTNILSNVVDPVNPQDAATRAFVLANSGANQALSNLTSTAVNQDLKGDTGTLWQIGTKNSASGSTQDLYIRSGAATVSGNSGLLQLGSQFSDAGDSGVANFFSGQANGVTSNTGDVSIGSGLLTNAGGTGKTGDLILSIGTIASGGQTRGKIKLQDGSEGTSGYLWASSDVNGSGHWVVPSSIITFVQETPTGTIDGVNTVFTLSRAPKQNASLLIFLAGLTQKQGTAYTISSATVTFTVAPAIASVLIAYYI